MNSKLSTIWFTLFCSVYQAIHRNLFRTTVLGVALVWLTSSCKWTKLLRFGHKSLRCFRDKYCDKMLSSLAWPGLAWRGRGIKMKWYFVCEGKTPVGPALTLIITDLMCFSSYLPPLPMIITTSRPPHISQWCGALQCSGQYNIITRPPDTKKLDLALQLLGSDFLPSEGSVRNFRAAWSVGRAGGSRGALE